MSVRLTLLTLAAILALSGTATAEQQLDPAYWTSTKTCEKGYRSKVSYSRITMLLRNHRPLTKETKQKVHRYVRCVATRAKTHAVQRHVLRLRKWRMSYAHRWPITFNRLSASWQQWAIATSSCESGMNPATNTGNGFEGAFQFMYSTWQSAGGTGHAYQHSWAYQAVIAVRWRQRSSQSQWPNCAPW